MKRDKPLSVVAKAVDEALSSLSVSGEGGGSFSTRYVVEGVEGEGRT